MTVQQRLMKFSMLHPSCPYKVKFSRYDLRKVRLGTGCYVLASYEEEVLYVGQGNVHDRMEVHLGDPEKTAETKKGKAFWFCYLFADSSRLNGIEGGWIRQYEDENGMRPLLNKQPAPAPTSRFVAKR